MKAGESYWIVRIESHTRARRERLGAFGLIAGSRIHLKQKRPAFVIRIGETDLALDADLARDILVRRADVADHPG